MIRRAFHAIDAQLNRLGVFITDVVSSMWCAVGFAILASLSLPTAIHNGEAAIITWIAQTFLQLTLLSVIMVGQEVQAQRIEMRDLETHDTVIASQWELHRAHREHAAKLDELIRAIPDAQQPEIEYD